MTTVTPQYGFHVQPGVDEHIITYRHGKFTFGTAVAIFIGGFLATWFAFANILFLRRLSDSIFDPRSARPLLMFAIIAATMTVPLFVFINRMRSVERAIVVRSRSIEANKRTYDLGHVSNIFAKGPRNQTVSVRRTTIVGGLDLGGTIATGVGALGEGMNAINRAFSRLSEMEGERSGWSIWLTYGSHDVRIAHGLDERRATALMDRIHRLCFP